MYLLRDTVLGVFRKGLGLRAHCVQPHDANLVVVVDIASENGQTEAIEDLNVVIVFILQRMSEVFDCPIVLMKSHEDVRES